MKAETLKTLDANQLADHALSCVIDSAWGIYVGQRIGELYSTLISDEHRRILADTDHAEYCEVWCEVSDNIDFTGDGGMHYRLYTGECGDVFEVNTDLIDSWEAATGLDFWELYA